MRWLAAWMLCAGTAHAQGVSWPVPSSGARLDGSVLVSLDPDLRAVRAIDVALERELWHTRLSDEPRGGHELDRLPSGRVLVIGGPRLFVLDPSSGAIVASHTLGGAFGGRSFLWAENGVCGVNTECAFQPIDCDDAHPIGEVIRGRIVHRRAYDGSDEHVGCWGFGVSLVARRAGTIVIDVDQPSAPPERWTLDARTGAIRARRPIAELRRSPPPREPPRPAREVIRDVDTRTAFVRRVSDGAVLERFESDAWSLGEHAGRTVVFVYREGAPGEVRIFR